LEFFQKQTVGICEQMKFFAGPFSSFGNKYRSADEWRLPNKNATKRKCPQYSQ